MRNGNEIATGSDNKNNHKVGLLRILLMNPTLLGVIALVLLGVILYTTQAISSEADDLLKMYDLIGNVRKDSKSDFDKRLFYITINTDGTKSVTVGFSSEIEKEQSERAASEAGTGVGNFDNSAISTELDKFITDVRSKEPTISLGSATVGYYVMNLSNDLSFAAGVMGNSAGEGTLGQWQRISGLTSLKLKKGTYSPNYSGKKSHEMNTKCSDLYADLKKVSTNNNTKGTQKIGWGPTQATYYTHINKYVKAMETFDYHTSSEIVTENHLKVMESAYVTATFDMKAIRDQNTSYMRTANKYYSSTEVYNNVVTKMNNKGITLDKGTVKSIVNDTHAVFVNYERPGSYNKRAGLNECTDRAFNAVKAYIAMQEVRK